MKIISLSIPGPGGQPIEVSGVGKMPQGGVDTLPNIIHVGLDLLLLAAIFLSLFFLVWGGFNWLMSEGEKQRINNARQKIIYAVLGLIVVFASFLIINVIYGFFLGNNASPLNYSP